MSPVISPSSSAAPGPQHVNAYDSVPPNQRQPFYEATSGIGETMQKATTLGLGPPSPVSTAMPAPQPFPSQPILPTGEMGTSTTPLPTAPINVTPQDLPRLYAYETDPAKKAALADLAKRSGVEIPKPPVSLPDFPKEIIQNIWSINPALAALLDTPEGQHLAKMAVYNMGDAGTMYAEQVLGRKIAPEQATGFWEGLWDTITKLEPQVLKVIALSPVSKAVGAAAEAAGAGTLMTAALRGAVTGAGASVVPSPGQDLTLGSVAENVARGAGAFALYDVAGAIPEALAWKVARGMLDADKLDAMGVSPATIKKVQQLAASYVQSKPAVIAGASALSAATGAGLTIAEQAGTEKGVQPEDVALNAGVAGLIPLMRLARTMTPEEVRAQAQHVNYLLAKDVWEAGYEATQSGDLTKLKELAARPDVQAAAKEAENVVAPSRPVQPLGPNRPIEPATPEALKAAYERAAGPAPPVAPVPTTQPTPLLPASTPSGQQEQAIAASRAKLTEQKQTQTDQQTGLSNILDKAHQDGVPPERLVTLGTDGLKAMQEVNNLYATGDVGYFDAADNLLKTHGIYHDPKTGNFRVSDQPVQVPAPVPAKAAEPVKPVVPEAKSQVGASSPAPVSEIPITVHRAESGPPPVAATATPPASPEGALRPPAQEAVPPPAPAAEAGPAAQAPRETPAPATPTPEPVLAPAKSSGLVSVPTKSLSFNPDQFQYKLLKTGPKGETGSVTKKFNPELSGVISVWQDKNGKTWVVNGHNRASAALRDNVPTIDAKFINAPDAKSARVIGAMQNIAEGNGTALDAAKLFRDIGFSPEDLKAEGLSLRKKLVSDGMALSKLNPEIFQAIYKGTFPEDLGVVIGTHAPDPATQTALLAQLNRATAKGRKLTPDFVREAADMATSAPKQVETQDTLFGPQANEKSLFLEKADVAAHVRREISSAQKIFSAAASEKAAEKVRSAGNVIDPATNKAMSKEAAVALEMFDREKNRTGPISTILNDAARQLGEGKNVSTVKATAYEHVTAALSDLIEGGKVASASGSEAAPGGQAGLDLGRGNLPASSGVSPAPAAQANLQVSASGQPPAEPAASGPADVAPAVRGKITRSDAWKVTKQDYISRVSQSDINVAGGLSKAERERVADHKRSVEYALEEGKPVPAAVLADYPDLAAKYGAPKAEPAPNAAPMSAPKPLPEELKVLVENGSGMTKDKFLKAYQDGLSVQNLTRREGAQKIDAYMRRTLKMTPEQFYDTYVAKPDMAETPTGESAPVEPAPASPAQAGGPEAEKPKPGGKGPSPQAVGIVPPGFRAFDRILKAIGFKGRGPLVKDPVAHPEYAEAVSDYLKQNEYSDQAQKGETFDMADTPLTRRLRQEMTGWRRIKNQTASQIGESDAKFLNVFERIIAQATGNQGRWPWSESRLSEMDRPTENLRYYKHAQGVQEAWADRYGKIIRNAFGGDGLSEQDFGRLNVGLQQLGYVRREQSLMSKPSLEDRAELHKNDERITALDQQAKKLTADFSRKTLDQLDKQTVAYEKQKTGLGSRLKNLEAKREAARKAGRRGEAGGLTEKIRATRQTIQNLESQLNNLDNERINVLNNPEGYARNNSESILNIHKELDRLDNRQIELWNRRPDAGEINPFGRTGEFARKVLDQMRAEMGDTKYNAFLNTTQKLGRFWREVLNYTKKAGLISEESHQHILNDIVENGDYLGPFRILEHLADHGDSQEWFSRRVALSGQDVVKALEGTTKLNQPILEASVAKIYRSVHLAERNRVTDSVFRLRNLGPDVHDVVIDLDQKYIDPNGQERYLYEVKNGKVYDKNGDVVDGFSPVPFLMDGEKKFIGLPTPVAAVLNELDMGGAGLLVNLFKYSRNALRTGATGLAPTFPFRNFPRDVGQQLLTADYPLNPLNPKDWRRLGQAFVAALTRGERGALARDYELYNVSGGSFSTRESLTRPQKAAKVLAGTKGEPFERATAIPRAVEEMVRFAVMEKSKGKLEQKYGVTAPSLEEIFQSGFERSPEFRPIFESGMQSATSTTDFRMAAKVWQQLNLVAAFVSARVGGWHTSIRGASRNPARAAMLVAAAATVAALMRMWNHRDEETSRLTSDIHPNFQNDNLFLNMGGVTGEDGKERAAILSMAKPEWAKPVMTLADEAVDRVYGKGGTNAQALIGLLSDSSPFQFEVGGELNRDRFVSQFEVPFVGTYYDLRGRGYDPYRHRELLTDEMSRRNPELQYYPGTSLGARAIGKAGAAIGLPMSPVKVEHAFQRQGGEIGNLILQAPELVAGRPEDRKDLTWQEQVGNLPMVRAVYSVRGGWGDQQAQEAMTQAEQKAGSEQFLETEKLKTLLRQWPQMPLSDRQATVDAMSNDEWDRFQQLRNKDKKGFGEGSGVFTRLKSLGVDNGERAQGIINAFNTVTNYRTPEERTAFLKDVEAHDLLPLPVWKQVQERAGEVQGELPPESVFWENTSPGTRESIRKNIVDLYVKAKTAPTPAERQQAMQDYRDAMAKAGGQDAIARAYGEDLKADAAKEGRRPAPGNGKKQWIDRLNEAQARERQKQRHPALREAAD